MKDHYVRSAALHRSHCLRQTLVHPYLGDNRGVCRRLADEIGELEYHLYDMERSLEPLDYRQVQTCREMLSARIQLYNALS
jgi:hypothetical protein